MTDISAEQRRELLILATALVLAMSTWFSTAAVLSQLRVAWTSSGAEVSWLTIVVQLGFVAGALSAALSNLADRIAPRRLLMLGAFGAAGANAIVVVGVFTSPRAAGLAAFAVIGIGALGSIHAGLLSDRVARTTAAALAMRWSGAMALVTGFLVGAPWPIVLVAGLVWGFWVVADSAQFSTIVTEVVDPRYVGTALTIQLASGFVLTVFTIFLVPVVRDALGWGWAFAILAPGPMLGAWAMSALRSGHQLPAEVLE